MNGASCDWTERVNTQKYRGSRVPTECESVLGTGLVSCQGLGLAMQQATYYVATATALNAMMMTTLGFTAGKCLRLFDLRISEMVLQWFLVA